MLKIAFPTDDGTTISAHFGRAPYFVIVTLDEPHEPRFEQRAKSYHGNGEHEPHDHHGHDHTGMFAPLADCQVLIAGGMGQPAYDSAIIAGLTVIPTGEKSIAAALEPFRVNGLVADPQQVYARH